MTETKSKTAKTDTAPAKPKTLEKTVSKAVPEEKEKPQKFNPKEVDDTQYVTVKNGVQGMLVYVSPRSKEVYTWESFGDEVEMELRELKNAKAASRAFFENNWFMFDEDWIPEYLGVAKYYKNAVSIEEFDAIFDKPLDEMLDVISKMSDGQKKSVSYRARVLIAEEKIDSNKTIKALEELLGTELIER